MTDKEIRELLEQEEFKQHIEVSPDETFKCDYCATDIGNETIEVEHKHGIDVAYYTCNGCGERYEMMYDSKATNKLKAKVRLLRVIQHHVQLELYIEMRKAEGQYLSKEFEMLSDDEKALVGEYVPRIAKEQEKVIRETLDTTKYGIRDLLKLL